MVEQPFLAPQSTAITAERAIGANDAMTWDDDAHHVFAIGATDRATHLNIAQSLCHPGIGSRFTQRNRAQGFPCAKLKRRSHRRQGDIELEILSGEIIGQLRSDRIEMSMLA